MKIIIDESFYPIEAIVSTSFLYLEKAYVFLDKNKNKIEVSFNLKEKISAEKEKIVKEEFLNELLVNSARLAAAKRNKKVREFIVGKALFSTIENSEDDDYFDELNIDVPWEESK